jgi:hypothetical protein
LHRCGHQALEAGLAPGGLPRRVTVYLTDPRIIGSEAIQPTIVGHLIEPDVILKPFTEAVYDQFLIDRSKKIINGIKDAVSAEPLVEQ